MKLKKIFPTVTSICFLNLNWLSIVMLNRLILFTEQEIFLPLYGLFLFASKTMIWNFLRLTLSELILNNITF